MTNKRKRCSVCISFLPKFPFHYHDLKICSALPTLGLELEQDDYGGKESARMGRRGANSSFFLLCPLYHRLNKESPQGNKEKIEFKEGKMEFPQGKRQAPLGKYSATAFTRGRVNRCPPAQGKRQMSKIQTFGIQREVHPSSCHGAGYVRKMGGGKGKRSGLIWGDRRLEGDDRRPAIEARRAASGGPSDRPW